MAHATLKVFRHQDPKVSNGLRDGPRIRLLRKIAPQVTESDAGISLGLGWREVGRSGHPYFIDYMFIDVFALVGSNDLILWQWKVVPVQIFCHNLNIREYNKL